MDSERLDGRFGPILARRISRDFRLCLGFGWQHLIGSSEAGKFAWWCWFAVPFSFGRLNTVAPSLSFAVARKAERSLPKKGVNFTDRFPKVERFASFVVAWAQEFRAQTQAACWFLYGDKRVFCRKWMVTFWELKFGANSTNFEKGNRCSWNR